MKIEEAHWFNDDMKANLREAHELTAEVDRMNDKICDITDGFANEVMRQIELSGPDERADIEHMIDLLPRGFNRSELRTALIQKFGR